jgi:hypothetical protein
VAEKQGRTLFFRMIAGANDASAATNIVGLTDKSQRSYGDEFLNIGPVLYAAGFTNELAGTTTNAWYIGARNGWQGGNTSYDIDYPGAALDAGVVYNVWIDITNSPAADALSDTFTVYIQKPGETSRSVLFQDYTSDRDLNYVDPVLGGFLPILDKLVIMGNSATYSALFDDFYLSTAGYNATVPRPYEFTGSRPAPVASIRAAGGKVEISWTGGTLQHSATVQGPWTDVSGNPASPYIISPTEAAMFYRTRQ